MPTEKISLLAPAPNPVDGSELAVIVQSGTTYKITIENFNTSKRVKISIPSADILNSFSVPILAIAAPGAGYHIRITSCSSKLIFNSIAYATELDLAVYTDTANNVQYLIQGALNGTVTGNKLGVINSAIFAADTQLLSNKAIYIEASGADPTLGNSDVVVYLSYEIVAD